MKIITVFQNWEDYIKNFSASLSLNFNSSNMINKANTYKLRARHTDFEQLWMTWDDLRWLEDLKWLRMI